jgi:XTP/dITP diphosphohydrolase
LDLKSDSAGKMGELKILAATTNLGKVQEIKKLLEKRDLALKVYSLLDLNIKDEFIENGKTFEENAKTKANFYSRLAQDWLCIGEDSGLMVEALGGDPGIFSARYAGPQASDEQNIKKLLQRLKSAKNRKAAFVCVAVLSKNGQLIDSFQGWVEGIILDSPRGTHGFGYDPVFYYPPLKKSFAELTIEEKNKISHRSQALKQLIEFLQSNFF